ncbi:MAG: helix-turn-helix transcriptional regulator [Vicinamibacterales bacterium]
MRRADRLFQIVQWLQRRRRSVTTAAALAARLGVSERTVYRDIRDLVGAGTPIDGEAGVGYRLKPGADLPPLMFSREEVQALVLGVRIVRQIGDPALAAAAAAILDKVAAVMPGDLTPFLAETRLYAPPALGRDAGAARLGVARQALVQHRRLRFRYTAESGRGSRRTVRPLGVFFWGRTWTLSAWCELRRDFRNFRLDRIADATLGRAFEDEPGRTLRDMLAAYGPQVVSLVDA